MSRESSLGPHPSQHWRRGFLAFCNLPRMIHMTLSMDTDDHFGDTALKARRGPGGIPEFSARRSSLDHSLAGPSRELARPPPSFEQTVHLHARPSWWGESLDGHDARHFWHRLITIRWREREGGVVPLHRSYFARGEANGKAGDAVEDGKDPKGGCGWPCIARLHMSQQGNGLAPKPGDPPLRRTDHNTIAPRCRRMTWWTLTAQSWRLIGRRA
ncbi:hypothetical protein F5X68DRAFT_204715, partial [Plectosphaerella plurivora]